MSQSDFEISCYRLIQFARIWNRGSVSAQGRKMQYKKAQTGEDHSFSVDQVTETILNRYVANHI